MDRDDIERIKTALEMGHPETDVLRDLLAGAAKRECLAAVAFLKNPQSAFPEVLPCGQCIVCIGKEERVMSTERNIKDCEEIEQRLQDAAELFPNLDIAVSRQLGKRWEMAMVELMGIIQMAKLTAVKQEEGE